MAAAFLDLQLQIDPVTGICDLAFDGRGFPFDTTAGTPMLISLGSERRADPDDMPPGTVNQADTYSGGKPSARRGWTGDALDANGALIGSRLWLLDDAKQTPDTRLAAISYALEAMQWIDDAGTAIAADASWFRPNMLGLLAQAGSFQLKLPISLT